MRASPFPIRSASVWNQLLVAIAGIVLIVWLVLAISIVFFIQNQRDYDAIAHQQVPDLALVSELTNHSARLSTLSARVVAGDESAETTAPELNSIVEAIGSSLDGIRTGTDDNATAQLVRDISADLTTISKHQTAATRAAEDIALQLDQLRWLNADIQGEVDPLLSDFAFNVTVAMSSLVRSSDPEFRAKQAELIAGENELRNSVRRLGDIASNTVTLIVQAAVASDTHQLDQLRDLTGDALASMEPMLISLPPKPEYSTLRQSIEGLTVVANSGDGVFPSRQAWLTAQEGMLRSINGLQDHLQALQSGISQTSEDRRALILDQTQVAIDRSTKAIRLLIGLTVLTGLLGAYILFGYVRTGVVTPLRRMTRRLLDMAAERNIDVSEAAAGNEIERLSFAIAEFERSIVARNTALADLQDEVSERQKTVERLKLTQKELIQAGKMAALGQMSSGIAHELNQPLAAMKHRIMLMDHGIQERNDEATERQLNRLDGLVDRMTRTISYFRNFARRAEFQIEILPIDDVIEASLGLVTPRLRDADIEVLLEPEASGLSVLGDRILIEQVLVNVLSNALDAIEQGELPGTINIRTSRKSGQVELRVRDNGIGLGPLSPTDALDPFVTTKDVGKGLGLGLSISYNIMQDLDGDLSLVPNADAPGTTAVIVLSEAEETA